jgi:hypothetical protein
VTMVFESAHAVKIDIESPQGSIDVTDLHREAPEPIRNGEIFQHRHRFECLDGEIFLKATGFKMYVRQTPILVQAQALSLHQRNGVSFGRSMAAELK